MGLSLSLILRVALEAYIFSQILVPVYQKARAKYPELPQVDSFTATVALTLIIELLLANK